MIKPLKQRRAISVYYNPSGRCLPNRVDVYRVDVNGEPSCGDSPRHPKAIVHPLRTHTQNKTAPTCGRCMLFLFKREECVPLFSTFWHWTCVATAPPAGSYTFQDPKPVPEHLGCVLETWEPRDVRITRRSYKAILAASFIHVIYVTFINTILHHSVVEWAIPIGPMSMVYINALVLISEYVLSNIWFP